ncbi:branched-chain amino acid ABC transporter substrate-binding protein [Ktedonobacter robiniae]|uniref:Branched chain amino acid ABC transporter substrate-binding protein n=1 Tax=Ktedonobacter robiniae TaxID=2778365 RepID=A0ABQ3UQ95_9CHLR|nr:branched-chain amino acid ABC transporter substrate-binding protein [Ktedonobacter robiniae]GHO54535.1 branched chain amino acid ABC transporter substrate-binding protein [Ktedonobacter robiniae]
MRIGGQRQQSHTSTWKNTTIVSLGILLLLLTACGPAVATGSQKGGKGSTTIKVATDFPVSGQDTPNGKPAQDGAEMAVQEANAQHLIPGYNIVFVPKDDVGAQGTFDPDMGKNNVTALINDALVAGIVGPFNSSVAQAEMPIANQAPITLISPSNTNTCLTQRGPSVNCTGAQDKVPILRPTGKVTYFRIATTDDHQGSVLADYLYQKRNYRKVYVIDDTTVYGVGLANIFSNEWQKLGGQLVGNRESKQKSNDYGGTIANIKSAKPDLVFYGGTDSQGGTQLRQQLLNDSGTASLAFGGGDGIENPVFAQVVGSTGGPTFATIAKVNETVLPSAKDFITRYNRIYGENDYGAYSAAGYDCMNILLQAIKRALADGAQTPKDSNDAAGSKSFREAVIAAMQKTDYNGVTGHHNFTENGDTTNKVISVWQVANVNGKDTWKFVDQVAAK